MNIPEMLGRCVKCGQVCGTVMDGITQQCPQGGSHERCLIVSLGERVAFYETLRGTGVDNEGNVVAERVDAETPAESVSFAVDAGKPAQIGLRRPKRIPGFAEEEVGAAALAQSMSRLRGVAFQVEQKRQEDSDYADRVLVSSDGTTRLIVQIRHLDSQMIESLGKTAAFAGWRTAVDLADSVRTAIDEKAMVDAALKQKTVLLLILPTVIGQLMRQQLQQATFRSKGFREVWIAPREEEAFRVRTAE